LGGLLLGPRRLASTPASLLPRRFAARQAFFDARSFFGPRLFFRLATAGPSASTGQARSAA
jgi:hypothetical protein